MEAGERLALASVVMNLMVTGGKYFLGWFCGSLALLADALHSTADVVSSASIWVGIKLSQRKSKMFPYGLYKMENLAALITSMIILLAAYEIAHSILWASERVVAHRLLYTMGGVVAIILIILVFSRYELKQARKLNSPSLVADAHHLTTDLLSSAVILVGLAGTYWQINFPLDKLAALIIVVLVAWVGLRIALDATRVLLDASLDYTTLNTIREIILSTPQVSQIITLRGRNSGRYKFIEADLSIKVRELEKAHFVANQIENRIKSLVPNVDHVTIHYEPAKKDTWVVALPVGEDRVHLAEHFGEAPYFLLLTMKSPDHQLIEEKILENPHRRLPTGKGIKVSEWLLSQGVDEVVVPKSFHYKGPYYVFADAGVEMRTTDARRLDRIKHDLLGQ